MSKLLSRIAYRSALLLLMAMAGCASGTQPSGEPLTAPALLKEHCALIGEPRVERISDHVWAAIGYDLANEILIHTPDGNVIVDPLMSPRQG